MCGEHCIRHRHQRKIRGSPPHVRGTLKNLPTSLLYFWITPACAGNTRLQKFSCLGDKDHPRMCGEHLKEQEREYAEEGSPPHVRGTHFKS